MSGGNKKRISRKKSSGSKASKFLVSTPEPTVTRSKSTKKDLSLDSLPTEDVASPGASLTTGNPVALTPPESSLSAVELVKSLEERWDTCFSKMETAIRSGLSQSSVASASGISQPPTSPAAAAVISPSETESKEKKKKSTSSKDGKKKKKKKRRRTPSPVQSSSSGSEFSDSSSDESESSSDSESSEDESTTKKKSKKKGKYDAEKYLDEGDKIDSFERLVLANLRMTLKLFRKKRNIKGLLQHLIMVVEKAATGMFANDSLCKYNEAVRLMAGEKGLYSFGKIDPATIFKFLTYDGTVAAERAKKAAEGSRRSGRGRSGNLFACYAFNYSVEGCKGGCGYRHVCSSCGAHGHLFADCTTKKPPTGKSAKK